MKPGKVLLFGLLGLVVAQVIAYWQQSASPLLSSALTVLGGAVPLVVDYVTATDAERVPAPRRRYGPHPDDPPYPDARTRRQGPGAGGLLAGLLVLALVGGGVAYGATYLVGWVTGNEPSVQRLAEPVTGRAGALSVRIEEVGVGAHYTQVRLTATNTAEVPVTIPLFGNCRLVERGTPAFEARTGFATSVIDVPAGGVPVTQEAVFTGTPSDGPTSLTLACSTLFWQGFGQPQTLQVSGIALTAAG